MRSRSEAKTAGSKTGRDRHGAYQGRVLVDKTSCNSEDPICSLPEMLRSLIRHSRLGSSSSTGKASEGEGRRMKQTTKAQRMPYPGRSTAYLQQDKNLINPLYHLKKAFQGNLVTIFGVIDYFSLKF